jgi:hypothetical protein
MQTLKEFMIQQDKESKMQKIFDFFMDKDIDKESIDKFITTNKLDINEFNKIVYTLLNDFCSGGLWVSKDKPEVDKEQLKMGMKIEREHSENPLITQRISSDHLSEFSQYYSYLDLMERLMEKKVSISTLEKLL